MKAYYIFIVGTFWGYSVRTFDLHGWRVFFGSILVVILMELLYTAFRKKNNAKQEI